VKIGPYIIGIGGPSCAGKTALAQHLAGILNDALVFPLDSYYVDLSHLELDARGQWNFDAPDALDHGLFLRHLEALARGEAVDTPRYDFTTHCRRPDTAHVEPGRFLLIEGLFALYWPEARNLMALAVYVDAPNDVLLARRTARDVRERGRTPESVAEQFARTVRPMCEQFVAPTRPFADLVLDGTRPVAELAGAVLARVDQDGVGGARGP